MSRFHDDDNISQDEYDEMIAEAESHEAWLDAKDDNHNNKKPNKHYEYSSVNNNVRVKQYDNNIGSKISGFFKETCNFINEVIEDSQRETVRRQQQQAKYDAIYASNKSVISNLHYLYEFCIACHIWLFMGLFLVFLVLGAIGLIPYLMGYGLIYSILSYALNIMYKTMGAFEKSPVPVMIFYGANFIEYLVIRAKDEKIFYSLVPESIRQEVDFKGPNILTRL